MIYPKPKVLNPPIHTRQEINMLIQKISDIPRSETLLEIGAGTGRLTIPLLEAGYELEIVEPDITSVAILNSILKEKGLKAKIYNKIPDKKYTAIVGTDILHHLDLKKYIDLFYQHLKNSGRICFSEPNALNPFWYIQPDVFLNWSLEKGILACNYINLLNTLTKSGFVNTQIKGIGLLPRVGYGSGIPNLFPFKYIAYRYLIHSQTA